MDASVHPTLNKVTLGDLVRECCWARNTTLAISGYTPVELATGRRPTDHSDLEVMNPDHLSAVELPRDSTLNELALRAHLEARQSADLRRDLARRVLPSDGPYAHGDRAFVWIDDKAKYKAVGRWARARVISQNGAIVRGDHAADYVEDFKVFMTKIKGGPFSALNVSFENSS